nr:DUF6623 family protein [Alteraurantiacibacter aquimixticola]
MKIEYESRIERSWRAGFYIRVVGRPGTTNWFHFHIPTPVIVKDKRLMVDSAMLRFRCGSNRTAVTNVHVYDGERKIVSYDGLSERPTGSFAFRRYNVPGKPDIRWGAGISVGVSFGTGTDAERTIEFSSAGVDFNLYETLNVHVKTLTAPNIPIDTMFDAMRQVYEPTGIRVVRASDETLNLPALNICDVGSCVSGSTTAEQNTLFGNRNNVGNDDVVIYFVQATNPPFFGCAAHPNNRPGAVVAQTATQWTMAHEIGHVLGLNHVSNSDRLMTGGGTNNITNPPPDLTSGEIGTMKGSNLTINP